MVLLIPGFWHRFYYLPCDSFEINVKLKRWTCWSTYRTCGHATTDRHCIRISYTIKYGTIWRRPA